ncbi:transmembrane emp24 domain-containing protein 5 [Patella vulgata]|uniref:transmembrane emp24 domain-containing protein 5 n=1 Tax=Patella vulgata TaxID=6465 RepID=UPI00217F83A4|nr:transmembrane emp24 domain-containing protein 5 [Patella vulgata]
MEVSLSFLILLLAVLCKFSDCLEHDLTIDVGAGIEECLYQNVKKPTNLEIEYQVIDGGDLDVDFSIITPTGQKIVHDLRKTENVHKVGVKIPGAYRFCIDNTFSRFTNKVVFFEILTDDDDDEEDDNDWQLEKDEVEEYIDMTIDDLKKLVSTVKTNLEKSSQLQNILRVYEARDRNIQENNFHRVNFMSGVQLFIMISVGLTQVLMIRNLFTEQHPKNTKVST